MFTITSNLIFNPEHVACLHFSHNEDGSVKSARLVFTSGQEVRLRDESAQEVVASLTSDKSSAEMTAATSNA